MHGLIVADSLNIPNIRYLPKQPLGGTDFKFKDYYSVFEKERNAPFSAEMLDDVGDIPAFIHDTYNVAKEEVDIICENLLNVFPYRKRELR